MPNLFEAADAAERRASEILAQKLGGDEPITRKVLNAAMTEAFGGTDADGKWTQRDSFELLEHALAHHLLIGPYPLREPADVAAACDLNDRLPTQTVRSEDQLEWQQFSTPDTMRFLDPVAAEDTAQVADDESDAMDSAGTEAAANDEGTVDEPAPDDVLKDERSVIAACRANRLRMPGRRRA